MLVASLAIALCSGSHLLKMGAKTMNEKPDCSKICGEGVKYSMNYKQTGCIKNFECVCAPSDH